MSRKLSDLHTNVREKAVELIIKCQEEGIVLAVTQTYRTFEEQSDLWEMGRVRPGKIVTHAPAGYSWHNWRRAFDIAVRYHEGDITPRDWYDGPWGLIGEIGESLDLEWGGRWKVPDSPHFQFTEGVTLQKMLKDFPEGI